MVKFLAMQVRLRKITIEQVLEKYRDAVRELEQDNAAGDKLVSSGKLYKVLQAHTSQSTWVPGAAGTESLYARIDEEHDGTKYDPIPYEGNMALKNGKYYTQGGVLYRCTRDTGNPVYHSLSELVGIYVEVVSDGG